MYTTLYKQTLVAVCDAVHHVLYYLNNPFGKKSLQSLFLHLFNAVHRNMFRTAGTKETVSGVRCQLSGCRV